MEDVSKLMSGNARRETHRCGPAGWKHRIEYKLRYLCQHLRFDPKETLITLMID